jgi:hypothetical protein
MSRHRVNLTLSSGIDLGCARLDLCGKKRWEHFITGAECGAIRVEAEGNALTILGRW